MSAVILEVVAGVGVLMMGASLFVANLALHALIVDHERRLAAIEQRQGTGAER